MTMESPDRDAFTEQLEALRRAVAADAPLRVRARHAATAIRLAGGYRWVGLYDVGPETIRVIAWDGPSVPSHPSFPVSQGLNGAAVVSREPVIVQDVTEDPRYLATLGSTRAEMIVPVMAADGSRVLGTIDVESERTNAFADSDRALLTAFAEALRGLWGGTVI